MPIETLNFQGINRAISDYASAGACEELINLRPTTAGLVPVKKFTVKMENAEFGEIVQHHTTTGINNITLALKDGELIINHVSDTGELISELFREDVSNYLAFSLDMIHCAWVGNYILFSIADREDGYFSNIAFLWDGSNYQPKEANVPELNVSFEESPASVFKFKAIRIVIPPDETRQWTEDEVDEEIVNGYSAIQEQNPEFCFGPIIVAIAFKTTDGSTFWTNHWFIHNPIPVIQEYVPETASSSSQQKLPYNFSSDDDWQIGGILVSSYFTEYFQEHDRAYVARFRDTPGDENVYVRLAGTKVTMKVSLDSSWIKNTSAIKSVEVYASRPQLHAYPSTLHPGVTKILYSGYSEDALEMTIVEPVKIEDMELDNQLLYHQKSIPLYELSDGEVSFDLKFGGNLQTTEKTLDTDAGATTRFGNIMAYNARFHFFDSVALTDVGVPQFFGEGEQTNEVFVIYNDGLKDNLRYIGQMATPESEKVTMIIAPSMNVKEVIFYKGVVNPSYRFIMTPSARYNYSIFVNGDVIKQRISNTRDYTSLMSSPNRMVTVVEPSAINVTEQYNPFVFKVEHSYLAPGNILDVSPQMVAVADVSYGDYPLNVFTTRGVYALLQGAVLPDPASTVLYGAFRPISNLVASSNCISTENGNFFLSNGALWLIAGARAVLISDALSLGPHKYIRTCEGHNTIVGGYGAVPCLSTAIFEKYVEGAHLSYNRFRDELIISNPQFKYSYVLSLKYRQWFKISDYFKQNDPGCSLAITESQLDAVIYISGLCSDMYDTMVMEIDTIEGKYTFTLSVSSVPVGPSGRFHGFIKDAAIEQWEEQLGDTILAETTIDSKEHVIRRRPRLIFTFPFKLGRLKPSGTVTFSHSENDNTETENIIFGNTDCTVVDFSDEGMDDEVSVHLQSRPFSFSYMYSHVHRIVSMLRASLGIRQHVYVALYGSDDLQNWTLISYADRTNETVSQIRTPSAGRSWRYYTVTIGGNVPHDTDFGPVLVDYKPVIRRIG